ncbi:MAG: hypothetical protein ABL973_17175 [Micropepsaceae bacterium]
MARVTITETGRTGQVQYAEGVHTISGYWEFGGSDVVAIVSMGSREDWQRSHAWATGKRADILRLIADEVIRQRAPSCKPDIDEQTGDILLRQSPGAAAQAPSRPSTNQAKAAAFVFRLSYVKAMFATGLLIAMMVIGTLVWLGQQALTVSPVSGTPLNDSLRLDSGDPSRPGVIATLIQTTDPHMVEISGRGGNTTTSLGILLTPLDGSTPHLVPVVRGVSSSSTQLARIMGSDGHTVWFDATGLYGVRLDDYSLVTPADLRAANPDLDPSWWEDQRGMDVVAGKLHIMNPDRSAALDVDPETLKTTSTTPKPPTSARFMRHDVADDLAAGVQIAPGASLGFQTSAPGLGGTVIVSRKDGQGKVLWSTNTNLDRFTLKQILPGPDVIALIGERPPIPDKLSEPLLVLVDTKTGKLTTHSLWR